MKKITPKRLDQLDKLPFRENRAAYITRKHGNMWNLRRFDYPNVSDKSKDPYTIANRIIAHNVGKSFDLAFSYYCTKVSKNHQRVFLRSFNEYSNRRRDEEYSIDCEGNIVYTPYSWRTKHKPSIQSKDYIIELQHKVTRHKKDNFSEVYEQIPYEHKEYNFLTKRYDRIRRDFKNGRFLYYEYNPTPMHLIPIYLRYRAQKDDFIPVVVSGWKQTFSSRNDPQFKKYQAEKRSKDRKSSREGKAFRRQIDYQNLIKNNTLLGEQNRAEIRRKQLEAIKKEEQANLMKIISHGFDPLTSFRN